MSRYDLPDFFDDSSDLVAVEVGVHQAVFAAKFMEKWKGHLHLVDPWESYGPDYPTFYPNFQPHTTNREQDYQIAKAIMAPYEDRVTFHRTTSFEAAKSIGIVDLVYIDGLHDYNTVSQDISLWFSKVRNGGLLCGHDYCEELHEVMRAVDAFASLWGYAVSVIEDEMPSWMIVL